MKTKRPAFEQAYVTAALSPVIKALNEGAYFDFGKFVIKEAGGKLTAAQINDRLRHVLKGTQGPSTFIAIVMLRFGEQLARAERKHPRAK